MANKWYPVIDYMTCTECGLCALNCPHGVYDKAKAPTPVVTNPAACIDHCRYCANNCPVGAISYVGDKGNSKAEDSCGGGCCGDDAEPCCGGDTKEASCCGGDTKEASCCGGDTKEASCCGGGEDGEPCGGDTKEASCCGGGCCEEEEDCGCGCDDEDCQKTACIEYLYLDLHTCDRCMGTGGVLDEVMEALTPALQLAGYKVEYEKVEMATEALAKEYEFLSSPTIRVNGRDICQSVAESKCSCCGEISGTDVDCRVFEYGGKTYEVPPKEYLATDILKTLFAEDEGCGCGEGCDCGCGKAYEMPDNLKEFFKGKRKKAIGWCKESCC